jgi:predicted extracellular nuclease
VRWLATDPTGSTDSDFLLLGDMNAYAMEDPIKAFEAGGYVNMLKLLIGDTAYSYVFNGETGYLDHALASPSLVSQIKGIAEFHINADEPIALHYDVSGMKFVTR